MADLRANARAGNGQSATVSSLAITIPAESVAGDVALMPVDSANDNVTLATPAGWTLMSGPDRVGENAGTGWLFRKTLGGGDPGATVTLTFSKSQRCIAQMAVYRDVTATGILFASRIESVSANTTTLPSLGSVPGGSLVHAAWLRRFAGSVAANVVAPDDYLQGTSARVATAYGSPSELSVESAYLLASTAGTYGGETAAVSSSSIGVNYVVALRGVNTAVTVEGTTALASAEARTGAVSTGGVLIEGVPATASVTTLAAGEVTASVEVLASAQQWPPEPYREAIRNGLAIYYTVDASFAGQPVTGATALRPTGGTITDTARPGVRRTLDLELADPDGELFARLAPSGTVLTVTAWLRYTDRNEQAIPMGVYVVDSERLSESSGQLSVTAPDKWSIVQRAKFLKPKAATRGGLITDQIASLIRGALGPTEAVVNNATSLARVGQLTWEQDRDEAITDLAAQIGAWVYFDRDGVATIANTPRAGGAANWLIDASASGVLIDLDRELSRTDAANVVVVESSASDDAKFPTVFVWDSDPNSATYAGPDPVNQPTQAGPFGVVPVFESSPNLASQAEAIDFAGSVLARRTGLLSQVSLEEVPNPALDAFDVIDVLPPGQEPTGVRALDGFGLGGFGESAFGSASLFEVTYRPTREVERHIADTVTHPLTVGPAQRIEGRATNVTALPLPAPDPTPDPNPTPDPTPDPTPTPTPTTKTLFGYNGDSGQYSVATRMTWWGRAPIVRKFRSTFVPAAFEYTTTQCPEKRVVASFKPDGTFTAASLASGGGNARFKSWLESIPAGWTVYATYFHEPNDEIRAGTLNVADYRNAWPHFRSTLNSASLNTGVTVKLAPCFISYRLTDAGRWSDSWVPPAGSFDTLTFDMYGNPGELGGGPSGTNRYGTAVGTQYGTLYPPPETYLPPVMDIIRRLGYAQHWGVLEINSPTRSYDPNETARARWFKDTYDYLLAQPYPPEVVTLWENVAQYDHTFGRLSGSPTTMINALAPYIKGSP